MKNKKILYWFFMTLAAYIGMYFLFIYNKENTPHILIYLYILLATPAVTASMVQTPLKAKMHLRSLFFYITLGIFIIVPLYVITYVIGFSDVDSVRYALSALLQGEVTIIALIVTLTLVAVQYASSSYSNRIIDIFKNHNPDFNILLVIYITSIIYGFFTLINVDTENLIDIKTHVCLAFSYGLFALIALFPYMRFTLNLLKPSRIIEILIDDITYESLISTKEKQFSEMEKEFTQRKKKTLVFQCEKDEGYQENTIQPIFDILIKSLKNHDYPTFRVGVSKMVAKMACIYNSSKNTSYMGMSPQSSIISDLLNNNFNPLIRLSIENDDEFIVTFIIRYLGEIGFLTIKNKDFYSMNKVISYLEQIGEKIIREKYDNSLFTLLVLLNDLKIKAPTKEKKQIKLVIDRLNDFANYEGFNYVLEAIPAIYEARKRFL